MLALRLDVDPSTQEPRPVADTEGGTTRRTTLVCRGLGVLLLAAAVLKVQGGGYDPVAKTGMFALPAFQFLVIALEAMLGFWLLSGRQQAGAWTAAFAIFLVFTGVSFYQGMLGRASCGCFGKVTVNPWLTFTIDLVALAALLLAKPNFASLWEAKRRILGRTLRIGGAYLSLLAFLGVLAHLHYGSIGAALANLRGERLSVLPAVIDMGEGAPGETRQAAVDLANRTGQTLRVVGGTADCSCSVLGDLPVAIPPGETRSITVSVKLPRSSGTFDRKAKLTIDDDGFATVGLRLTGRITPAPE